MSQVTPELAKDIEAKFAQLQEQLAQVVGEAPPLEGCLFLIGIQEQGVVQEAYSKEEKTALIDYAMCTVLEGDGYFSRLVETDGEEERTTWKQSIPLPKLAPSEQDLLLKQKIVEYFTIPE